MDIYERLKQIPNSHLLTVRDIFRDDGRYALVTEYADGGYFMGSHRRSDPDAPRTAMDEATVKQISLAILDGLCALHENDIVHRDPPPAHSGSRMALKMHLPSASGPRMGAGPRLYRLPAGAGP